MKQGQAGFTLVLKMLVARSLLTLPSEVILLIAKECTVNDVESLSATCRALRFVANPETIAQVYIRQSRKRTTPKWEIITHKRTNSIMLLRRHQKAAILNVLLAHFGPVKCNYDLAAYIAAREGRIDMLDRWSMRYNLPCPQSAFGGAAMSGHIDIYEQVYSKIAPTKQTLLATLKTAVGSNRLEFVERLLDDSRHSFTNVELDLVNDCAVVSDRFEIAIAIFDRILKMAPDVDLDHDECTVDCSDWDIGDYNQPQYSTCYFNGIVKVEKIRVPLSEFRDNIDDGSSSKVLSDSAGDKSIPLIPNADFGLESFWDDDESSEHRREDEVDWQSESGGILDGGSDDGDTRPFDVRITFLEIIKHAIINQKYDILRSLIDRLDLCKHSRYGCYHQAVVCNFVESLRILDASRNRLSTHTPYLPKIAASQGNLAAVEYLLVAHPEFESTIDRAFIIALRSKQDDVVEFLLPKVQKAETFLLAAFITHTGLEDALDYFRKFRRHPQCEGVNLLDFIEKCSLLSCNWIGERDVERSLLFLSTER